MNKEIITIAVAGTRLETTDHRLAQLVLLSATPLDDEPAALAAGAMPAIGEFWTGQGGIYAGLVRGTDGNPDYHLVVPAGSAGCIEKVKWGGHDKDEPGATSDYDGAANTAALVSSKHSHPAAEWAAGLEIDGLADFYLPSRRELALCYANVPELFEKRWHWSSTQYSPYYAWVQYFGDGNQLSVRKDGEYHARAVRRALTT